MKSRFLSIMGKYLCFIPLLCFTFFLRVVGFVVVFVFEIGSCQKKKLNELNKKEMDETKTFFENPGSGKEANFNVLHSG